METNLNELYAMLENDETERNQHPCCYNCANCYREYGVDFCKVNDYPEDDMDSKCDYWI